MTNRLGFVKQLTGISKEKAKEWARDYENTYLIPSDENMADYIWEALMPEVEEVVPLFMAHSSYGDKLAYRLTSHYLEGQAIRKIVADIFMVYAYALYEAYHDVKCPDYDANTSSMSSHDRRIHSALKREMIEKVTPVISYYYYIGERHNIGEHIYG